MSTVNQINEEAKQELFFLLLPRLVYGSGKDLLMFLPITHFGYSTDLLEKETKDKNHTERTSL